MSIKTAIADNEAALFTIDNGNEIEMRLPTLVTDHPPLMKFLAACLLRADEELGWWEDQVRWYEAYNKGRKFLRTRAQLRVVRNGPPVKPKRKQALRPPAVNQAFREHMVELRTVAEMPPSDSD